MRWEGEEVSRGEGEKSRCRHHPQAVRRLNCESDFHGVKAEKVYRQSFMKARKDIYVANDEFWNLTSL